MDSLSFQGQMVSLRPLLPIYRYACTDSRLFQPNSAPQSTSNPVSPLVQLLTRPLYPHRPHHVPYRGRQALSRLLHVCSAFPRPFSVLTTFFHSKIIGMELIHEMDGGDFTNYFLAFPEEGRESQTQEEKSARKFQREGVLELCHSSSLYLPLHTTLS